MADGREEDAGTVPADAGRHGGGARPAAPASGLPAWPLHPFLLAAAAVLALYAGNLKETGFGDIWPTLAAVLAGAAALWIALALALGPRPRAAIIATIAIVTVLYPADLLGWLDRLSGVRPTIEEAAPWALLLALALAVLVARSRRPLVVPNALLNGLGIVLVAFPAWTIGRHLWEAPELPAPAPPLAGLEAALEPAAAGTAEPAARPDIYHIVFDRYGSAEALERVYGFDNRPLLGFLRDQGFYVAEESFSNYPKTAPSLAATFHMDYLDALRDHPLALRNEWHPIYDMLEGHRVGAFLRARGYRWIQLGAWWRPTQANAFADEVESFGFSEFARLTLQRSLLPPLVADLLPGTSLAGMLSWNNAQCWRVPLQVAAAKAIAARPEPTFTFVHILVPHDPFVFDENGACLSREAVRARGRDAGYVAQVAYANRLIRDLVTGLLAGPEKPVVILQADEGPYPESYTGNNNSWREATPEDLATKSGILNAWYLPDGDYEGLHPGITPVNTYRLLFDRHFGTRLGPLPDRVFHFTDYNRIYDWFEVTDQVRQLHAPGE